MKTIPQTRALNHMAEMFRGHFSPMAILTILQIAQALYKFKSDQGHGFSSEMCLNDFSLEMAPVETKDLIALLTEFKELDNTGVSKREFFMAAMKRLMADEVVRQQEIELAARVAAAEELRKQEQIENQILTMDAQSKILIAAREGVVSAQTNVIVQLEKLSIDRAALAVCVAILQQKKNYLVVQEQIFEEMSEACVKAYFPSGMKL
jgi:hypothetical protein